MILELFFDLASPYAYLALMRMAVHPRAADVQWHPLDGEQVKRAAGNVGPSLRHTPAKLRYVRQDVARWARRMDVPFSSVASCAPAPRLNRGTFYAADRGCVPQYLQLAGRRIWGHAADPDADDVLRSVAADMDWDAREFLAFVGSPAASARSAGSFARARRVGVFGVPTAVVGERLWWGNDRLHLAEAAWLAAQPEEVHRG
jgi:2-hydroxychromene-2-carboxylate isomerase